MNSIYKSRERVYCFDFEPNSMYLAVGSYRAATVYISLKSVIVDGLCEMKTEYKYESKSAVVRVIFVKQPDGTVYLVIGNVPPFNSVATKDGEIAIVNIREESKITFLCVLHSIDEEITSLSACSLPDVSSPTHPHRTIYLSLLELAADISGMET